ncbi:hypothetical protein CCP4SC76_4570005 [Gammaproteobacteria bacterium]
MAVSGERKRVRCTTGLDNVAWWLGDCARKDMVDVGGEGLRRCRRDNDCAIGQNEDDGVPEVRGEEAEAAELGALVETSEPEQASITDDAPSTLADRGIRKDTVKTAEGDVRCPEEPLNGEVG